MERTKVQYVCQTCGHASPRWLGRCPSCGEWNTLVEEIEAAARPTARRAAAAAGAPVSVAAVALPDETRTSTGVAEFDRVLGGGLVRGSVVLVGGDPGTGKTTLLTQVGDRIARAGAQVLYVTAEESVRQTRLRAERLGATAPGLLVLAENDLEVIAETVGRHPPAVLVVDSIQTVYRADVASAPGSVAQVRECAAALVRLAKDREVTTVLVGHVTKEGALAGPRVLEHLVDTVLYFEGDRHHAYRILRATKNRFGSTNEIGVFEMAGGGLVEVPNPSAAFLSERARAAPGSTVVCAIEGSRPLLVEVQALVSPTHFGLPRRTATGVDYNRLLLLLAVLERRAGLHLASQDVYASIAGGISVEEPAADLGIAAAVASSLRDRPVDPQTVVLGEVGLAGEVRAVPQIGKRLAEAARLGFARAVLPRAGAVDAPSGLELIPVADVSSALRALV
jgi:DNA repair protein RadA/Sms